MLILPGTDLLFCCLNVIVLACVFMTRGDHDQAYDIFLRPKLVIKSFADVDFTLRVLDLFKSAEMGFPEPCMTRIR